MHRKDYSTVNSKLEGHLKDLTAKKKKTIGLTNESEMATGQFNINHKTRVTKQSKNRQTIAFGQ